MSLQQKSQQKQHAHSFFEMTLLTDTGRSLMLEY